MPVFRIVFAGPVLAAMLALSGCGGGGGGGGPLTNLPGALVEATKAGAKAKVAADAAHEVVDMAGRAAEALTAVAVQGDATTARINAQAVLGAETAITAQLEIAQGALEDTQETQAAAQALTDSPDYQALLSSIDDQVKKASSHVDEIAGLLQADADLKRYIAIVKGPNGDRTPEGIGQDVAMAIAGVIGIGAAPDNDFTAPALSTRPQNAAPLMRAGAYGMTWAEIHGKGVGDSLAVPIAGMTATDISALFGSPPADGYAIGVRVDGVYRGIPGVAQCQGTCSVDAGGALAGNWIFLPDSTTQGYVQRDDGSYAPPTDHVEYGHWLDTDPNSGNALRLNLYVGGTSSGSEAGDLGARAADADGYDGDVARYAGRASGMSLTREVDANGTDILHSGAFTADAHLTARFGNVPTVSGYVDNFDGGAHVNPAWRVDLETMDLSEGTAGTGIADGGADPGAWSSDPYAPESSVRPTGINGAFHAHFGDGHAIGVYAVRNPNDSAED